MKTRHNRLCRKAKPPEMRSNGPWARTFGVRGEGMRWSKKEKATPSGIVRWCFPLMVPVGRRTTTISPSITHPYMVKWGERAVPLRNNLVVVWQQVGHLKDEDQILDHSIKPQNISLTATPALAYIVTVHLGSHPESRPPTSFFNLIQTCIRQLEGCLSNRSSSGFCWRSGGHEMQLVRRLGGHCNMSQPLWSSHSDVFFISHF